MKLQTFNWYSEDDEYNEEFKISCYGRDKSGESIHIDITGFTPFFFLKVSSKFNELYLKQFITDLKEGRFEADNKKIYVWKTYYASQLLEDKCKLVSKKDFMGFTDGENFKFIRLTFSTLRCFHYTAKNIFNSNSVKFNFGSVACKKYETFIEPIFRFFHIKNISPCGWIKIKNYKFGINSYDWEDISSFETDDTANFIELSYDIETYSSMDNNKNRPFPNPGEVKDGVYCLPKGKEYCEKNEIFQIGVVISSLCSDKEDKYLIHTGDKLTIPGTKMIQCKTEKDLIIEWAKLINIADPDVIYSYNGDMFDAQYIYTRSVYRNVFDTVAEFLSRDKDKKAYMKEATFSSSAYGLSKFNRLIIPGRFNFDILVYLKREFKEDSYKLDNIAEKYLKDKKDPVSPEYMFRAFETNNIKQLQVVGKYCVQDTLLVSKLVKKLSILTSLICMSNVVKIPIHYLIEKGQMIKGVSLVSYYTRKENYLISTPEYDKDKEIEKYKGACVLEPIKGVYNNPITVLDFASLYPSIMIAHNLCPTTLVLDEKYNNIPGATYYNKTWEDEYEIKTDVKIGRKYERKMIYNKHSYTFYTKKIGIIPKIEIELGKMRKHFKILMNKETDEFKKNIYNGNQLAYKITMNSLYGIMGCNFGPLSCQAISATITAVGREMIHKTKDFVENKYNSKVVYGDSCVKDTPITFKQNGMVKCDTIHSIWNKFGLDILPDNIFKKYDNSLTPKERKMVADVEVWSNTGWTKVKSLIRHKTHKKIYETTCFNGQVATTGDHALLSAGKNIVKPTELKINTSRLFIHYPTLNTDMNIDVIDGTLLGHIINRIDLTGNKYYNNPYIIQLHKDFINYDGENYVLPDALMNINIKDKIALVASLSQNNSTILIKDKLNAQKMYNIIRSITHPHLQVCIKHLELFGLYNIYWTDEIDENLVVDVKEITDYKDYVYDIETDDGTFQAGTGSIIIFNTDSVFIEFDKINNIEEAFDIGKVVAKEATDELFNAPIKLEFEKVYKPFMIFTKKRYIGDYYSSSPHKPDFTDSKGIVLKRRDNANIVKRLYGTITDLILAGKDIKECLDYLVGELTKLYHGDYILDEFVQTANLCKDEYKSKSPPAHVALRNKMFDRDPSSAPKLNERIPFVIIKDKTKKLVSQRAEHPEYVKENGLELDIDYYIEFKIKNPIQDILELYNIDYNDIIKKIKLKKNTLLLYMKR